MYEYIYIVKYYVVTKNEVHYNLDKIGGYHAYQNKAGGG